MQIGSYKFKPRLVPSLLTLLLLPIMIALGFWQLDRAEQKFSARELREHRMQEPPSELRASDMDLDEMLARRVTAQGHFDLAHQFLLQNQLYREQPGYLVYTPLYLTKKVAVLVNRGWVAAQFGKDKSLPDLDGPAQEMAIAGVIDTPPSIGLKLGDPGAGSSDWPRQVQYLDLQWAEQQLGYRLLPYVLLPAKPIGAKLAQMHRPEQIGERGMPPEKHVSYAVQWFALAFALVVIFVVVNFHRDKPKAT